jgi:hypothetical protein
MGLENLKLKKVSAEDQQMIKDIEVMLGPEPSEMGFVKNLFWGRFRDDLVFPYPRESKQERERCDALLAELDAPQKAPRRTNCMPPERPIADRHTPGSVSGMKRTKSESLERRAMNRNGVSCSQRAMAVWTRLRIVELRFGANSKGMRALGQRASPWARTAALSMGCPSKSRSSVATALSENCARGISISPWTTTWSS